MSWVDVAEGLRGPEDRFQCLPGRALEGACPQGKE